MTSFAVDWTWTPVAVVAVYAAVVASLSFFLNVLSYKRDSAQISVKVDQSIIIQGHELTLEPFFSITANNIGRRTVMLVAFGFLSDDKSHLQVNPYNPALSELIDQRLPIELSEGNSEQFIFDQNLAFKGLAFKKTIEKISTPPKKAYVRTAVGQLFTCTVPTSMRDEIWGDSSYRPYWKCWEQGWWPWK